MSITEQRLAIAKDKAVTIDRNLEITHHLGAQDMYLVKDTRTREHRVVAAKSKALYGVNVAFELSPKLD